MFGWKKLYLNQVEITQQNHNDIIKLRYKLDEYNEILNNIDKFNSTKPIGLGLYTKDRNIYAMYAANIFKNTLFNTLFECDIFTYNLNNPYINYDNWITKSQIEIHKLEHGLSLELVNIDTRDEVRKGHASKQIDKMLYIAQLLNISKIYGELFIHTNIGIDNLRDFYRKNGFTVTKHTFYMKIKQ